MKKIKIAQIGTMHDHASDTFRTICQMSDCFEVLGVAEPSSEGEVRVKAEPYLHCPRYSVEELLSLDGLEAVCVETDEHSSTYYATLAFERGLAVHLDKPGAPDLEAFEKMIIAARDKRLPLQMGYMYRYNPLVKKYIAKAKAGELGDIISVEAQMSIAHSKEKRAWLSRFKGGMMYFLGCHIIDLVLQIQGLPDKITSYCRNSEAKGTDAGEDYGFAVLEYPRGVSLVKASAAEVNGFERRQLVISGSEGTVEIKPIEKFLDTKSMVSQARATYGKDSPSACFDCSALEESEPYHRYTDMMREFALAVSGDIENPYSYDYELQLFKCILKCCGM